MGYLSHIAVAFAAVVAADLGFALGPEWPWMLLPLLGVPSALGRLARVRALRGRFASAARASRLLSVSAPLLFAVLVCAFGWHAAVRRWLGSGTSAFDWPEPALLLSLAPYALLELASIEARARMHGERGAALRKQRLFHLRMFASGLLPLALYLAAAGLLSVDPVVRAHVEEIGLLHGLFAALSVALFALAMPAMLRNTFETAPLEPGLARVVLEAVAAKARFRCRGLYVWRTGNLMSNAAILGFLPAHRSVLFSDALLAELSPRELAAVFAHEIGHAARHHVLVFGAWTLGAFLAGDLILTEVDWESDATATAAALGLVLLWYVSFGWLSRRFELEADLASIELTGDADALVAALEAVGGVHSRERSSWRHFSTAQRVLFARALERDPGVGRRLVRTLRAWTVAACALFVAAAGLQVTRLTLDLPEDRIDVELRLGRYERARARVVDDTDGELAALVRLAADAASGEELAPAELEARAVGALEAGDAPRALAWLELAARRGRASSIDAVLRLDRGLRDGDAATELMADLAAELRAGAAE